MYIFTNVHTVNSRYNEHGYIEIPVITKSVNSPKLPNELDHNKVRLYRNGYIEFRLYRSNFYPTDLESNYLLSAYIEIKIFLFRIQTPLS